MTFEQWCKERDEILVTHTTMPSACWPDLVFYRDHFDDGISTIESAALLMDEVCESMGMEIHEMFPSLAQHI